MSETMTIAPEKISYQRFYFGSPEEYAIYKKLFGEHGPVEWISGDAYIKAFQKGSLLFEAGRYFEAIQALQQCFLVNPVAILARFEMCECYIALRQFEKCRQILLRMEPFLLNKGDIAAFYRRMGFLEVEAEHLLCAVACFKYSRRFEDHIMARSELQYIDSIAGRNLSKKVADPLPYLKKESIPIFSSRTPDNINGLISER